VIDPTEETLERVRATFDEALHQEVEDVLLHECGSNLLSRGADEEVWRVLIERVRFSVLKVANGSMSEFRRAVAKTKRDWRDILRESGFSKGTTEHLSWKP
jgi:hypothetical protein